MFIGEIATAALVDLTVLPVTAHAQVRIGTMEKHSVLLPSNIDFSWNSNERPVTLVISTGCQSGSLRPAGRKPKPRHLQSGANDVIRLQRGGMPDGQAAAVPAPRAAKGSIPAS